MIPEESANSDRPTRESSDDDAARRLAARRKLLLVVATISSAMALWAASQQSATSAAAAVSLILPAIVLYATYRWFGERTSRRLWVVWARLGRRSSADAPWCGKCGYSARGAQSMTCSECGADYRLVGMVMSRTSLGRWSALIVALIVWSVFAAILGFPLDEWVMQYAAPVRVLLERTEDGQSTNMRLKYESMVIGDGPIGWTGLSTTKVKLPTSAVARLKLYSDPSRTIEIEAVPGEHRYVLGCAGQQIAGLDKITKEEVLRQFANIGLDTQAVDLSIEAEVVVRYLNRLDQLTATNVLAVYAMNGVSFWELGAIVRTDRLRDSYSRYESDVYAQSFFVGGATFNTNTYIPLWFKITFRSGLTILWALGIAAIYRTLLRRSSK